MKIAWCYYLVACRCAFAALPVLAQPPELVPEPKTTVVRMPPPEMPFLPIVTWDELQKRLGGLTLVTLHAENLPVEEMLDTLSSPGILHRWSHGDWTKVAAKTFNGDYEAQPFWLVARDVAQKLQISLGDDNTGAPPGVLFIPWPRINSDLTQLSGPCLFVLEDATLTSRRAWGDSDTAPKRTLDIRGHIYLEPKLVGHARSAVLELGAASDDKQLSWLPSILSTAGGKSAQLDMLLRLQPPPGQGEQMKRLSGKLHLAVATRTIEWEVPDVLNAHDVEKTFSDHGIDYRLELVEVKKTGAGYLEGGTSVRLIISQSEPEKARLRRFSNNSSISLETDLLKLFPFRMVDEQGRELTRSPVETTIEGDAQTPIVTLTLAFSPNLHGEAANRSGPPAKLLLSYDTDWSELIVPFEFKDVPLP